VKYEKDIKELQSNFDEQIQKSTQNEKKVSESKTLEFKNEIEQVKINYAKEI
jgi:hypothetical protein